MIKGKNIPHFEASEQSSCNMRYFFAPLPQLHQIMKRDATMTRWRSVEGVPSACFHLFIFSILVLFFRFIIFIFILIHIKVG